MKELISIHDRYRFEIKLNLDESSSYKFEYYFFLPSSLNISCYTYDKFKFYSSLQRYIRYQTPEMDLYTVIDLKNSLSPLSRIIDGLNELKRSSSIFVEERVIDEMKLLGAIIRDKIRDAKADELLSILKLADESFQKIAQIINSYKYSQRIVDTFKYVDEYLNIIKIEKLSDVLEQVDINEELKRDLLSYNDKCFSYIDFNGYKKISPDNIDSFLYYRGLLKKFVSSCLFLKVQPSFDLYSHIISSIASAIAMLFAILVTIYIQKRYPFESVIFIVLVIISYVFKDRIKEFSKIFFSKIAIDYIYDRKLKIYEPVHNIKIGYIKESFSLLSKESIADDVLKIRNIDNFDIIDEDAKFEVVLKYKKIIFLKRDIINIYHTRRKNLVSILRFSIEDFLKHTDDAITNYSFYHNSIKYSFNAKRNYHLNLIVKSFKIDEKIDYKRYRIIFNRNGILKVENII